MLTTTQTQIIDTLTAEFEKLNFVPKTQSRNSLINKDEIDARTNESNKIRQEILLNNKAVDDSIKEMMINDIYRLNEDLLEMGLVAFHIDNLRVGISKIGKINRESCDFWFRYTKDTTYVSLKDHSTITRYDKFRSIESYLSSHRADEFKTLEAFTQDSRFIRKIEKLYKS
jgi:hypothetical protein